MNIIINLEFSTLNLYFLSTNHGFFLIFVEQHAFCWIQTALIIIIIFGHFSSEALSAHFINNKKN